MAAKDFTLLEINLHDLFYYKDGKLFYKSSGKIAGWEQKNGYAKVEIKDKAYCQHRIIFLMQHGFLPKVVDHIDGNKLNNNIANLRAADQSKNTLYSKRNSKNTSGVKGVSFHKQAKKWWARVCIDGKRKSLGLYNDINEAKQVMIKAREHFHGEFAHHG